MTTNQQMQKPATGPVRVVDGNQGVARLTPAPTQPGTYLGMPKFPKAAKKQTETSLADVLEASLAASGGKERKRA